MKTYLTIGLGIIVLVIAGVLLYLTFGHKKAATNPPANSTFPVSTSTNPTGSSDATTPLTLQDGSIATAKDFIHNGVTFEDPANKGTYYIAGSSGACNPDGSCPKAGDNPDFIILYYAQSGSFNIALTDEPLGKARQEAEQYLMNTLGITEQQMCNLNYILGTSTYVNSQYGQYMNLGFSFCPGAVVLPQ